MFHLTYWMIVCYFFIGATLQKRLYLRTAILETYQLDTLEINIIVALYKGGDYDSVRKSVIGIVAITFLSVSSVLIYIIIGLLIAGKLNSHGLIMSKNTKRLQRQLVKALIVQSIIPTLVSFVPCIVAWYQPVFGIDIGR
uniref:G protein-coupled receptor n=1 Tax=Caenorhabditis japonica TaxID=281687 RepID=A0A8R1DYM7_CAEJA